MGLVAFAAVDLAPAEAEVESPESGPVTVMTGEALLGHGGGQETIDPAVVWFMAGQAIAIGGGCVGEVPLDQPSDVLVATGADPRGLIGQERSDLSPVRQVASAAFARGDRGVRGHRAGRRGRIMALPAKLDLAFHEERVVPRRVHDVAGPALAGFGRSVGKLRFTSRLHQTLVALGAAGIPGDAHQHGIRSPVRIVAIRAAAGLDRKVRAAHPHPVFDLSVALAAEIQPVARGQRLVL